MFAIRASQRIPIAVAVLGVLVGSSSLGCTHDDIGRCDEGEVEDDIAMLQIKSSVNKHAVPHFVIDLDLPPKKRWTALTKHYREEMIAMGKAMKIMLEQKFTPEKLAEWKKLAASNFERYPDYLAELEGIATAVNHTGVSLDMLKLNQMIYELASPTYCSSAVISKPDGTVMHGRNMDYAFHFQMPDGRILNWPDVTHEVTLMRGGKPVFKATSWPGGIGFHTAMRFDGWTIDQQTRLEENSAQLNFEAAKACPQCVVNGIFVRQVLESTPDFKTAVEKMYAGKFIAPQYFVMTGADPKEGTIITTDRQGHHHPNTPGPVEFLKESNFFVQTNYDWNKPALDQRRNVAINVLESQEPTWASFATKEHLMQMMHTPNLFNPETVFSVVMIPSTNFYETRLPSEAPPALSSPIVTETIAEANAMWGISHLDAAEKFLKTLKKTEK